MLAVLFLGLVVIAGLVYDGRRLLAANTAASDLAGIAARVGAQDINPASIRAGHPTLDTAAATADTTAYLTRHHATGQVRATATTVTVTVHLPVRYQLLALSGTSGQTITQTRSAGILTGP
jgi:hypothetical protein